MHRKRAEARTAGSVGLPGCHDDMSTRGNRCLHLMAQVGTSIFAVFGGLLLFVVTLLIVFTPAGGEVNLHPDKIMLVGLLLGVPLGMVFFALVGHCTAEGARAWLSTTSPAAERKARGAGRADESGTDRVNRWQQYYERCLLSAIDFHRTVRALSAGSMKNWFAEVGRTLDAELAEALRLATLGNHLEEGSNPEAGLNPAGVRLDKLLRDVATAFELTSARTNDIALHLRDGADHTRVQAQLDVLVQRMPRLRADSAR